MSAEGARRPWFAASLLFAAAALVPLALTGALHCDEANVLRHVTDFGRGDWSDPGRPGLLWLALTPLLALDDPVAVVAAARLTAVAASLATLFLAGRIAARASGPAAAPVTVLLLVTSMSWTGHAIEVRTDTYAAPLALGAALLLWRRSPSLRAAVGAGLLLGAAGLVSQKSLYNAVAVAAGCVAVAGLLRDRAALRALLVAAVAAIATVGLWYGAVAVLHGGDVGGHLGDAAANAFDRRRALRTNLRAWGSAASMAAILYGAVPLGLAELLDGIESRRDAPKTALLAASAAALATLAATIFVHRGFFLYFIASFEPWGAPLAAAGLLGLGRVHRRLAPRVLVPTALLVAAALAAPPYQRMLATDDAEQTQLLRDVAEAFPEPVPYWDSVGLVPGYPETTFFGTARNRSVLRERHGRTLYRDLAAEGEPRFYVRNYMTRDRFLTGSERRWLRRNYVPWRPNLYVRGGRAQARGGRSSSSKFELLDGGTYRVWFAGDWSGAVAVAAGPVAAGETRELAAGRPVLGTAAVAGDGEVWLLPAALEPSVRGPDDVRDYSLYPVLSRRRKQHYDGKDDDAFLLTPPGDPWLEDEPDGRRAWRYRRHRDHQRELRRRDWR